MCELQQRAKIIYYFQTGLCQRILYIRVVIIYNYINGMFRGLGLGFHQAHWSVVTQLTTQWGLFTSCKGASMSFTSPSLQLLPCNLPYIPSLPITLAYLPYRILYRIDGRRPNVSARERNSGERLVTETKSCHVFTIFRIVIL